MRGFVTWGPDHQAVLLLTVAASAALILSRQRLKGQEDRRIRRAIAAALLGNGLIALGIGVIQGHPRIPLQLCDLALMVTAWTLVSLNRSVAELAYFWGLAGSVQAVLTPDLHDPFPGYWWMTFFLGHCGVVLGVVYLTVTGRVEPTLRSVWRAWLLTNLYAAVVGLVNWRFGTNYGYLAHKPMQPSLLDYLGPWPYYIVGMEIAALLSLILLYVPFSLARRAAWRAT